MKTSYVPINETLNAEIYICLKIRNCWEQLFSDLFCASEKLSDLPLESLGKRDSTSGHHWPVSCWANTQNASVIRKGLGEMNGCCVE